VVVVVGAVDFSDVLVHHVVQRDLLFIFIFQKRRLHLFCLLDIDVLNIFKNSDDINIFWVNSGEKILDGIQFQ